MCELFGVTAKRNIRINSLLETFFSHSAEHQNGWGIALFGEDGVSIDREPVKAIDSSRLKGILNNTKLNSRVFSRACAVSCVNIEEGSDR